MKNKFINLAEFRRRNGLSQAELAKEIESSVSYISMVETGNSKMSIEKMRLLWEKGVKKYFMEPLVPAYHRLQLFYDTIINNDEFIQQKEINKFKDAYATVIPQELDEQIKFGQQGIEPHLADSLIAIAPIGCKPRKEWLIQGEGAMFSTTSYNKDEWKDETIVLTEMLHKINERLDSIQEMIEILIKK